MKRITRYYAVMTFVFAVALIFNQANANNSALSTTGIVQLTIDGGIGPATQDYIQRGIQSAEDQQAEFVILQIDTPGGLDTAMRAIIKSIANANIPIVSYVSPSGARAASAGTYIMYASHIAAMAPGTNIGAATPVKIGGGSPPDSKPDSQSHPKSDSKSAKPSQSVDADKLDELMKKVMQDPSQRKAINDAVAYIQGLAQLRGRNAEWAEKAVREAASLSANEALALNVIDLIASSRADLLDQLNGRTVSVQQQTRQLNTANVSIVEIAPDWRSRFLSVITNPNIAYILLLVGIYGLILEFFNPGAILPGTVGAISLLVALYAFQLLPVNYVGMALIFLGVALIIAEAFEPSFGVLGIGGLASFVVGSIILIDTDAPGYGIDLSLIITFTLVSVLILAAVVLLALKSTQRKVVSGLEALIGSEAMVLEDFDHKGSVVMHGEHWQAVSDVPLKKEQVVQVTGLKNLTLSVKPAQPENKSGG